ncbi:hypothetical protein KHA80_07460 [Anaerobacillus sp. HL2]|nr:hypothetical protein KHA80_07460 [Anaerobacillus sp. HL2]
MIYFKLKVKKIDPVVIGNSIYEAKAGIRIYHRIKTYLTDKEGIPEHNAELKV